MAILIRPPNKRRYWKARARNSQEILRKLSDYLNSNTEEPAEIMCGFWRDQANVFTYQELRNVVLAGALSTDVLQQWQRDYSILVRDRLQFMWRNALEAGPSGQPLIQSLESFTFNVERPAVMTWLSEQGANLVTACMEEQKEAIACILENAVRERHSVDELARMIRPCIGLTAPQARANLRFYENMVNTLRQENPRMRLTTAQKRAREAAVKMAERQHRQRAMTIAQTETAAAYNHGADEGIRQAQENGLIGRVVKRWCTSGDDGVCDMCSALEGMVIEMDAAWTFGRGWHTGDNMCPPAHPCCACAVEYIEE